MEKRPKRKGGAEKLREKRLKSLQVDAAKCSKISDMFAVASTTSPAAASAAARIEKEAEVQGESEEKEQEEEEEEDGGRDVTQQGQIEEVRLAPVSPADLSPRDVPGMCLSLVWTSQAFFTFGIFGVKVYLSLMWSLHVFLFYH
ncbi:uncharacterized protein LOC111575149 isoform X2 [Amphiprion ocellaris]|nr:uncharacterized protein LOC111575149 isoform X2 [Amphiprion ocellaris]